MASNWLFDTGIANFLLPRTRQILAFSRNCADDYATAKEDSRTTGAKDLQIRGTFVRAYMTPF